MKKTLTGMLIALFCLITVGSAFAEVGEDSIAYEKTIAQTSISKTGQEAAASNIKVEKKATASLDCFRIMGTTSEPIKVECGS